MGGVDLCCCQSQSFRLIWELIALCQFLVEIWDLHLGLPGQGLGGDTWGLHLPLNFLEPNCFFFSFQDPKREPTAIGHVWKQFEWGEGVS